MQPNSGERTILVHLSVRNDQQDLLELKELADSAGAEPLVVVTGSRKTPDPRYFIGKGKLDEIKALIGTLEIDLILLNHALTPSQERNLERVLGVRVLDRNGLILDIFAQRAISFEGKLQVELAQLTHLSTRLVRGWSHLERQKGGIGLRGPGETQLETDRRLIVKRIRQIKRRLEKVEKQRHQGRVARNKAVIPTVALVGYTNAGKSCLFNALTGSDNYTADQLFATLDPTLRKAVLSSGIPVVVADTVGFIRHLPHELVAAFRSTLQEASEAQLLLHVIDVTAEDKQSNIDAVNKVLKQIGADHIPQFMVYNKIDLVADSLPDIDKGREGSSTRIWLSAMTGDGLEMLDCAVSEHFAAESVRRHLYISPAQGRIRARLFDVARVIQDETVLPGGWDMEVEIQQKDLGLISPGTAKGRDWSSRTG